MLQFPVRNNVCSHDNVHTPADYPPGHSPPGWLFEAHVAEDVMIAMLAEANVTVHRGCLLSCVCVGCVVSRALRCSRHVSCEISTEVTLHGHAHFFMHLSTLT